MSISETEIARPRTRGCRGHGHTARHNAKRADMREVLRAMTPANPHAQGRIVAHTASRQVNLAEWDVRGAKSILSAREMAVLGVLRCRVCGDEMTVEDFDEAGEARHVGCKEAPRDTSRAVYAVKPVKSLPLPKVTWEIEQGTTTVIARVGTRRIPLRRVDGTVIRGKFDDDAKTAFDRLTCKIVAEYAGKGR